MSRVPTKMNVFGLIVESGLPIDVVYDVGVMYETHELRLCFHDKKQYLFEPVTEFHQHISQMYNGLDFELVKVAVSDGEQETGFLETATISSDLSVTHSAVNTDKGKSSKRRKIKLVSLSDFTKKKKVKGRILLKVDVDGHEMEVLNGAIGMLKQVDVINIEATMDRFPQIVKFISNKGFTLFDIADLCYYKNVLAQCDLTFIRTSLLKPGMLNPLAHGPLVLEDWVPYTPEVKT